MTILINPRHNAPINPRHNAPNRVVAVGGIEPEWALIKRSIAEAVVVSCGLNVLVASRGGNPRTPWWILVVREAVKSKKESPGRNWGRCCGRMG